LLTEILTAREPFGPPADPCEYDRPFDPGNGPRAQAFTATPWPHLTGRKSGFLRGSTFRVGPPPQSMSSTGSVYAGMASPLTKCRSGGQHDEEYLADRPTGRRRIGISPSGGGLRSAAFNLGALQAFPEEGLLGRAHHLDPDPTLPRDGTHSADLTVLGEVRRLVHAEAALSEDPSCENGNVARARK
jgi:hypothetical protein